MAMDGSGVSVVGEGEHTLSKGDTRLVSTIGECGELAFVSPIGRLDSSRIGDSAGVVEAGVGAQIIDARGAPMGKMGCEVLDVKAETIPPPGIEQIEIEITCRLLEVYVDAFNG